MLQPQTTCWYKNESYNPSKRSNREGYGISKVVNTIMLNPQIKMQKVAVNVSLCSDSHGSKSNVPAAVKRSTDRKVKQTFTSVQVAQGSRVAWCLVLDLFSTLNFNSFPFGCVRLQHIVIGKSCTYRLCPEQCRTTVLFFRIN